MRKLQTLLDDIAFDALPPAWTTFDFARFSKSKTLFDYQAAALENAVKALWKYYDALEDYHAREGADANETRKTKLMQWYLDNHIALETELPLGAKRANVALMSNYYPITQSLVSNLQSPISSLPYFHLINRIGFWMATGSGKTLVLVKLIEILETLMQRGEIPTRDILVLTHREDLLKQLRAHVDEYNAAGGNLFIRLRELKAYADVKREYPSLLGHQEITVFYYRSDNLSDEQKERIIDFRNYDNDGKWYVLLDEAHKGSATGAEGAQESKRQNIYAILARNGFLFNFSATFVNPRDILTTAHEFNLASFIEAGYGKHLALLTQENRAFKRDEDFTDEEKQKIVLQSLLALTYASKSRAQMQDATNADLFHRPLLIALVNSVNTEDADLKLFFRQLERIARGDISDAAFRRAKNDLFNELTGDLEWLYENTRLQADAALLNSLTLQDVLRHVFNADTYAAIEVLARPSNYQELAFKLKSAPAPFALIRIGDTRNWRNEMLLGYEFVEGFSDESFFAKLNADDTPITLLMGSRSFYEGWDSNRPNVITFINIGTGADAKKFVLQSVGRGVRIEPFPNKRKRLENLYNANQVDARTFQMAKPFLNAVQTLFIFGTNRLALESVLAELKEEQEKPEGIELALERNPLTEKHQPLLIPVYKISSRPLIEQASSLPSKFALASDELASFQAYLNYLGDERLLLAHHEFSPRDVGDLDKMLADTDTYFDTSSNKKFGNLNLVFPRLARYFDLFPRELTGFKPLADEINHYQHIRVLLKDIAELSKKIAAVQNYKEPDAQKAALRERLQQGVIDLDTYTIAIEQIARASAQEIFTPPQGPRLHIKNIAAHYYLPLLVSEAETIDYITHTIHVDSERRFIQQLENYLARDDNKFKTFDWWMFSRADEILDKVVIPYYDGAANRMREFHPDFIIWLKRWNDYYILFVDPKGMVNSDYQRKIDGYEEFFVDTTTKKPRVFSYQGLNVRVALAMHTTDANIATRGYAAFWNDNVGSILERLFADNG